MNLDLVREISASNSGLAIVSVARANGSVHSSLVNAGVLDHPLVADVVVGLVAMGASRKLQLLRDAGRATVAFQHGWQWAAVEGDVEIAGPDDPGAVAADDLPELLRAVFIAAGGTHDDWDEYDRTMAKDRRAAVLVHPRRILTNAG